MNSVRESKQELDAAIRYAENAISSAKQTIESMEFRQQMAQKQYSEQTGREAALEREVGELKVQLGEREDKWDDAMNENRELRDIIDRMGDDITGDSVTITQLRDELDDMRASAFEDAKTIEHLKQELQCQKDVGQGYYDDMMTFKQQLEEAKTNMALMEDQNLELKEKVQAQLRDIDMLKYQRTVRKEASEKLERDLTVKTAQAEAWKKEAREPKGGAPTMPVIPRDVAIAIFREGTLFGVEAACDEIQGETINISESDYVGDFSISFERDIDLDDHIDFDWVRSKIGDYDEDNVTANLEGLCAKNNFECRIHGIDNQEEKKND